MSNLEKKPFDIQATKEYWKEFICNEDGSINEEKVLRELSDFKTMQETMQVIANEVCGVSNINYTSDVYVSTAKEKAKTDFEFALEDALDDMADEEILTEEEKVKFVENYKKYLH